MKEKCVYRSGDTWLVPWPPLFLYPHMAHMRILLTFFMPRSSNARGDTAELLPHDFILLSPEATDQQIRQQTISDHTTVGVIGHVITCMATPHLGIHLTEYFINFQWTADSRWLNSLESTTQRGRDSRCQYWKCWACFQLDRSSKQTQCRKVVGLSFQRMDTQVRQDIGSTNGLPLRRTGALFLYV